MNNAHPLFRNALTSLATAPVKVSPAMRPYEVSIWIGGKRKAINVLALTSCDAVCHAIAIFFEEDDLMPPDGLEIAVHPMNLLQAA